MPIPHEIDVWLIELPPVSRVLLDAPWPQDSACARVAALQPTTAITGRDTIERVRRTVHTALRLLLARDVGVAAALTPFAASKAGKPQLPGAPAFSISHSGERALIALSHQGEVGVDLEAPRTLGMPAGRQEMIRRAGIAATGGAALATAAPEAQTLQAWVRLEAIAKYSGDGMGHLLGRLGIVGGGVPEAITPETGGYRLQDIPLDQGYHAAVAGRRAPWTVAMQRFPQTREDVAALIG